MCVFPEFSNFISSKIPEICKSLFNIPAPRQVIEKTSVRSFYIPLIPHPLILYPVFLPESQPPAKAGRGLVPFPHQCLYFLKPQFFFPVRYNRLAYFISISFPLIWHTDYKAQFRRIKPFPPAKPGTPYDFLIFLAYNAP